MAAIVIRNLSPETHRALQARAARHGRSTEAEARTILDEAVRPTARVKLGSHSRARQPLGGLDLTFARSISAEPIDSMILLDTNDRSLSRSCQHPDRPGTRSGCNAQVIEYSVSVSTISSVEIAALASNSLASWQASKPRSRTALGRRMIASTRSTASIESLFDVAAAEAVCESRRRGAPIKDMRSRLARRVMNRGIADGSQSQRSPPRDEMPFQAAGLAVINPWISSSDRPGPFRLPEFAAGVKVASG